MVSCREAGVWLSLGPPLDGDLSWGRLEGLVEMGVGGWGSGWPVVCGPFDHLSCGWKDLAQSSGQHRARQHWNVSASQSMFACHYRKEFVSKIWVLYIRSQEDFFFFFLLKCPQPVSMVVCVCLSSDGVRGAESGEGLWPFSLLGVGVPLFYPVIVSSAVGLGWGGDPNSSYSSGSWSGLWHWDGIQPWLVSGTTDRWAFGNRIFYSKYLS